MPEKKEFFTLRKDMLEKKYFFVITESRHAKSNNKQTPLSPNNEINKPTVGGYSDGKGEYMKRFKINELQFKKLIDGVKHCVSKDDSRPISKYIQIKVKSDTITAYAIDRYRAARVEIKNACPIDEEFTCYINPLTVKVSKNGINPVVIEQSDGKTFVEVATEYGILRYGFTVPSGDFPDVEKIYSESRQHDREIGLQPRYVIDALKALNGINHISGGSYAVLEIKENNTQPFIIRAKNDDIINEQLILPVRIQENDVDRLRAESKRFENNMKSVLEIEKKNVVKEFAEKLKARITRFTGRHDLSVRFFNDIVSDLLKKYEK